MIGGCGGSKAYYATIGAHDHLTVTSSNDITDGKIKFNKGGNFGLYLTVDHGYDPKTVEVRIGDTLLTPSEVTLQTATYSINSYTKDVTLEITSPQVKIIGVYDFFEVRKTEDNSVVEDDHNGYDSVGWTHGVGIQLTLEANDTLKYNAGNPEEPKSRGNYSINNDILSFTPIGEADGSNLKINTPFTPGYVNHTFADDTYYVVFKLDYAYVI